MQDATSLALLKLDKMYWTIASGKQSIFSENNYQTGKWSIQIWTKLQIHSFSTTLDQILLCTLIQNQMHTSKSKQVLNNQFLTMLINTHQDLIFETLILKLVTINNNNRKKSHKSTYLKQITSKGWTIILLQCQQTPSKILSLKP